jgi:hypothetical protein
MHRFHSFFRTAAVSLVLTRAALAADTSGAATLPIAEPPRLWSTHSPGALQNPPMKWADDTRLGRPHSKDPSVIRFGSRYLMYFSLPPFAKERAPANAPKGLVYRHRPKHQFARLEQDCRIVAGTGVRSKRSVRPWGTCTEWQGAFVLPDLW